MSRLSCTAVALFAAVACNDPARPSAPTPTLTAVSPTQLVGTVGRATPVAPAVLVLDEDGLPMANMSVSFSAIVGSVLRSGVITNPHAITNAQGVATAGRWILHSIAGENAILATVEGAKPMAFYATGVADTGAYLTWAAPIKVALPGMTILAPGIRLADPYGNAVGNAAVHFSITAGDGTLSSTDAFTDRNGNASAGFWTLRSLGNHSMSAAAGSVASPTFTARALDLATHSWYDLESIDGAQLPAYQGIVDGFIVLGPTGEFIIAATSAFGNQTFNWIESGKYVLAGPSLTLDYESGNRELGTVVNDLLSSNRLDDNGCCARWTYKKRKSP